MTACASFHLTTVTPARAPLAFVRLGTDRLGMRRRDGLRFIRLLGTGSGSDTGPGVGWCRTAAFAVWDDDAALDAFEAERARRRAVERYTVRLRPIGGHGTWAGFDVLGALGEPDGERGDGPVAMLTRARVRARHWRTFAVASRVVNDELARSDGLLAACGIGEAPIGLQATFSLWRDLGAARAFARRGEHHVDAVRRTRAEGWFGEELFAAFEPYASSGSWDGVDPLAALR